MAHKQLISGVAYDTKGGRCLVNGVGYDIKRGRTLIDGVGYDISFGPDVSATLDNNEWDVIKYVSDAGTGSDYWAIGDRKQVTLNGTVGACTFSSYSCYAFIIGFNHNSTLEGSNRIHFQFAKTALTGGTDVCFTDSYNNSTGGGFRMNTSQTKA